MNYIRAYWDEIEQGKVIVSNRVYKQYKKLIDAINKPGQYIFDEAKANRPIKFIETFCKHSKGEWATKSIELELFQKAYIAALFGFVDKDTGFRQYKESMFYIARKNGKSTMLSGIALYMMIADGEGGSDIFSVATKREQANLVFDETHNMIKQSPYLRKHIKKRKSDLFFEATLSRFQSLGRNSNSLDGLNAHLVVIDELSGIADRNLYEVMKQSQSARQQPLLIMITTAGTLRECIFDDMYDYSTKIVDDVIIDDTFLPILYELDDKDEYLDPDKWQKANPAIGSIKKIDDLIQKVERAKNSPKDLSGLLVKDFNIRDTAHKAWLTFDAINNEDTFNIEDFKGSYAIGGADLSKNGDLTAATLLLMDPVTEKIYIHTMHWLPEAKFKDRVEKDKIPYNIWKDQGLLRLCKGNTIRYSDVTEWFLEMLNDYSITPLWVYYDSWSAKYWVDEMEQHGFIMERCIQGMKTLSLPMQQMGADLEVKKINYNNNQLLKWQLTNVGIITDRNGNIAPIKSQAPKMKIDGVASMLNSYVGLMDHYEEFIRSL